MIYANDIEGTFVSKGLCQSIKLLTEQRLAFDTRMGERARASDVSASRNHQRDQISHQKPAEAAAHGASEPSHDSRLPHKSGELLMSKEARVTYMKLRGDQLLHLAEMARHDGFSTPQCEGLAAEALEAYISAQQEASSKINGSNAATNNSTSRSSIGNSSALPELHPMRVELALRISSVLFHLLDRPVEAWDVGYPVYLAAAEHPTRLGARGLAIAQALRDHLACIEIPPGGGGQQRESGGNSEEIDTRYDNSSTISHGQGVVHGTGEDEHRERLIEGEWGFLRMSTECDEAPGHGVGDGRMMSDKLRDLAQVKHARACMEAVTATDRVLLGTMEHADVVQSALKKVRATKDWYQYTRVYAQNAGA